MLDNNVPKFIPDEEINTVPELGTFDADKYCKVLINGAS
jgi:hypothetical protein